MSERDEIPDHRDPRALDGLRKRRRRRGLSNGPPPGALQPGANVLPGGGYQAVLRYSVTVEVVWACDHVHPRRAGDDRHGRDTPTFRSAVRCAQAELERRAAL